jgi:hypothetical protein
MEKESRGMTDQFIIDLGNDQRAVVEPDDATWLQDKLRREPGSTRLDLRYDDADTEGHGSSYPKIRVIVESDDDTEGHAIALNFPSREEAEAFRKRLMLAGVLAGTIAIGAVGGMGLANLSSGDAASAGAASTAVSGSDWSQVERPDAASITAAGSAWTSEERPAAVTVSDDGSASTDADAPSLGDPTPR